MYPPSRWSNSEETGTRVPVKQGVPPWMFLFTLTTAASMASYYHSRSGSRQPLGSQPEELGEVHEALGLLALLWREGLSRVLPVEQRLQPRLDRLRQAESRQKPGSSTSASTSSANLQPELASTL